MPFRERERVPTDVGDESRTKQSFAEETDANAIIRKYLSTGVAPWSEVEPQYGDFSSVGDYHSALNRVNAAHEAFASLPSRVRDAVGNDPGELLRLCLSEEAEDLEKAYELELKERPPEAPEEPEKAPEAPPGAPEAAPET